MKRLGHYLFKKIVQEHRDINGQDQIQRLCCEPLSYIHPCSEYQWCAFKCLAPAAFGMEGDKTPCIAA